MELSTYEVVYLIANIFGTYIVYKFMHVFFETKEANHKIELLSYVGYYIFIALVYLTINIPVITMICNILAYLGLSFNYNAGIKRRLLSILMIYLILICVEVSVALLTGYFNYSLLTVNNYSSGYGLVLAQTISYLVVRILNNYKNIRKGETIPLANWIAIILIPISSLYIILTLFQATGLSWERILFGVILILLVNFTTFYLYDVISASMVDKMDKILLGQQNKYYRKQFELMESSLKTTKAMRHDLRNHLSVIYALVEKGERDTALKHLSKMTDIYDDTRQYAYTENIDIDSILNFKIQAAEQQNIKIALDLSIPEKMYIPSFDLAIILGNLLDNAIEAVAELEKERQIKIKIYYDKGRLIILVENPFQGERLKEGNRYLTTNKEPSQHGLGLENIKSVLQKYDGSMVITQQGMVFSASLMLFV
ncbi:sensor histidine kinase [Acetobacterium carbinolicum]|uniref:sensor histidine kinase n=1 Tax=Acetobacterium carbinolicum TaxID=52690 RepID=UPI0039C930A2